LAKIEWAVFAPTLVALIALLPTFGSNAAAWVTSASYLGLFLLQSGYYFRLGRHGKGRITVEET